MRRQSTLWILFLYTPNHTTKKGAHIRDAVDLKRTMITVVLALVPALIFGMWNGGYQYFINCLNMQTVFLSLMPSGMEL